MTADVDHIAAIDRVHRRGDATEHSYLPALKVLLESRAANIEATNEALTETRRLMAEIDKVAAPVFAPLPTGEHA